MLWLEQMKKSKYSKAKYGKMASKCIHSSRVHMYSFICYGLLPFSIINLLEMTKTSYVLKIDKF